MLSAARGPGQSGVDPEFSWQQLCLRIGESSAPSSEPPCPWRNRGLSPEPGRPAGNGPRRLINHWAERIAVSRVEPYREAKQVWLLSHDWLETPERHRLSTFVGLASEWEDDSERRRELRPRL
jgi:hypothetical protein